MQSKLFVQTEYKNGTTRLRDAFFTVPYKVMNPFIDGSHCEIIVMAASAGMLGGDCLDAKYHFTTGSNVTIRTQSYEKILNTEGRFVIRNTRIKLEQNSIVRFLPHPIIPFSNSKFRGDTIIDIDPSATLFYSDIFTCGRTGMGEYYQMNLFHSTCKCYVGNALVFADNTLIDPARIDYTGMGMWQNYTHNGLLYAYFPDKVQEAEFLERVRFISKEIFPNSLIGASKCVQGIAVRVLAMSGEEIFSFFQTLCK